MGGFIGAETVLKQLKDGPMRRRVGIVVEGPPARRKSKLNTIISHLTLSQRGPE